MRKRDAQRGFTLIEVMMTMLVFGVSILGLVALQSASVKGTNKSREHTVAVNIARFFMTELQSEISGWRSIPPDVPRDVSNLFYGSNGFVMLNADVVQNAQANEAENWFLLDSTGDLRIDAYMGHNMLEENGESNRVASRYCVSYRVELMDAPQNIWTVKPTLAQIFDGMVWKLRVRVIWPRRNQFSMFFASAGTESPPCTIANINNWLSSSTLPSPEIVELVGIASREFAL